MIKQETLENGLVKTYSDSNKYIIQNETGAKYDCAIDALPLKYSYTPTSEKIKTIEDDTKNINKVR